MVGGGWRCYPPPVLHCDTEAQIQSLIDACKLLPSARQVGSLCLCLAPWHISEHCWRGSTQVTLCWVLSCLWLSPSCRCPLVAVGAEVPLLCSLAVVLSSSHRASAQLSELTEEEGSGGNAWLCPSTLVSTRGGGCSRGMKPMVGRGGFASAPAPWQPQHYLGWAPDC